MGWPEVCQRAENLEHEPEQAGFLTISVMSEIPGGNFLQAGGAEHPALSRLRPVRGGGGEDGRGQARRQQRGSEGDRRL